jgi:hypothetical protein
VLFLGGWRGPGVNLPYLGPILGIFYLFFKSFLVYFVTMWVRYSLPRIRIDHMLALSWKFLTPLSLILLVVVALVDKILEAANIVGFLYALIMLSCNLLIALGSLVIVRNYAQSERKKVADVMPVANPPVVIPSEPSGL